MPKKRIVLIVNPKAGQCKGVKQLGEITLAIQDHGYLPIVLMTHRSGDASRFAYEHGNDAEAICCVGGDGTFSEVVAGMVAGGTVHLLAISRQGARTTMHQVWDSPGICIL